MESFIYLGNIGDEDFRRAVVEYTLRRLAGQADDAPALPHSSAAPFLRSLELALQDPQLQRAGNEYEAIRSSIAEELLQRLDRAHQQFQQNKPETLDNQLFQQLKKNNTHSFIQEGRAQLEAIHPHFPTDFHQQEWQQLHENEAPEADFEALKTHLESNWGEAIFFAEAQRELEAIDRVRQQWLEEMYSRIEEFEAMREALSPFTDDVGRLWDAGKGLWKSVQFDILKKYAELAQKDKSLRELADLLGRLRASEQEGEEDAVEQAAAKTGFRYDHAQKSEFIGIRESDELSHLLPSELSLLANPETESLFFRKFAEKKLQTWEYRAKFLDAEEEKRRERQRRPKAANQGPLILCIDTSGSMSGTPEQVAKVLCFALLRQAQRQGRNAYLISFSTEIQTLDLSEITASLPRLIEFLGMSFRGGTDATPALRHALDVVQEKRYEKADILVVSDFVMPHLPQTTTEAMQRAQAQQTRLFSLAIARSGNADILNNFDANWIYNPQNPKQLLEVLRALTRK